MPTPSRTIMSSGQTFAHSTRLSAATSRARIVRWSSSPSRGGAPFVAASARTRLARLIMPMTLPSRVTGTRLKSSRRSLRSTRQWCWSLPLRVRRSPRERDRGRRQPHRETHIALGLGLAACQKGLSVGFVTAAALVHELIEARDEKRLLRLQRQLAGYKLLIIDELGYVPLSTTGAELLFEVFSQRYERGSTIVTSNLPFDEWTGVFGAERLTGALLDRLTHHDHILEMNGDSYRLGQTSDVSASHKHLS